MHTPGGLPVGFKATRVLSRSIKFEPSTVNAWSSTPGGANSQPANFGLKLDLSRQLSMLEQRFGNTDALRVPDTHDPSLGYHVITS